METIRTKVSRVENFWKMDGIPGENIGIYPKGVTREEIKEMLEKYKIVLWDTCSHGNGSIPFI